jgi:hypothetical protein
MTIKLTKLAKVENPICPIGTKKTFTPGEDNPGISPYLGYWIIGTTENKPVVGKSFRVDRTIRNGVECLGNFSTSIITSIEDDLIKTCNSVYKIEYL